MRTTDSIHAQLSAVSAVLRAHLGPHLRAIHLYGSAVTDGLKPHSDIDLMVAVATPLPEPMRQGLMQELLAHSAWPGSSDVLRALEVTVVALSEVVPWRYPPRREMQFGEWLRTDLQAGRFEPPMPDPDLAILLTKLRQHSSSLFGPSADELFEPVPASDLRKALTDTIAQWNSPAEWQGDERNIILALTRIWFTACTGEIAGKDRAATWAAERLPASHRAIVERALRSYLRGEPDGLALMPQPLADTIHFMKRAVEEELKKEDPSNDQGAR
ncbi:aminoglycoside adenylyltransferase family protein [Hydrogenophaga sp.]|uniref:aminoglycoside adenylyltransferase family protein n=1 Tax=Hydrogenophaga sp. TaxID=1904254 RepID=UPI003F70041C